MDIIGKWTATSNITCKNELKIKTGEEFEIARRFANNNLKVIKGKYIGILGEDVLLRSAEKRQSLQHPGTE